MPKFIGERSNMDNAIVFIHRGKQEYAKAALNMAERTQSLPIIWCGDMSNDDYRVCNNNTSLMALGDYYDNILSKEEYIHLSPNTEEYELFGIQRWYILRNLMIKRDIKKVWAVDSDVMCCSDLNISNTEISKFDVSFNGLCREEYWASPACLHASRELITGFCYYCTSEYKKREGLIELYNAKTALNGNSEGISDMVLWEMFSRDLNCLNLSAKPFETSSDNYKWIVDCNINLPENFEFDNELGIKKIFPTNGLAIGKYIDKGACEDVEFLTLHFQGTSKGMMPYFMEALS